MVIMLLMKLNEQHKYYAQPKYALHGKKSDYWMSIYSEIIHFYILTLFTCTESSKFRILHFTDTHFRLLLRRFLSDYQRIQYTVERGVMCGYDLS